MSKYRFKTREEFERDGHWNDEYQCPIDWNESGDMNHYLGEDVPEHYNEKCDKNWDIGMDGWSFEPNNYILKEENYTGRLIKALIHNPNCTGVKLGETIKIIGKKPSGFYELDKTSQGCKSMGIQCPLNTSEWELVEQPKDNSKVVSGYVKCVQALMSAKVGIVYPVVDEKHCLCEQGNTYEWDSQEFINSTKQEYDAQFSNEQDPLYICKQEYRKGMRVISASKTEMYSGEFIIDVDPKEFRNLSGDKDIVDYSCSPGYLYYKGEYAEILEKGVYDVSEIIKTNKPFVDSYLENSGFTKSNPEAYNWLMDKPKPSIETVHSVDVNLRTKKQINKLKF